MFVYYTLCALCILTLRPCQSTADMLSDKESMLRILTALNNKLNASDLQPKLKRDLLSVLNPTRNNPLKDEDIDPPVFDYFTGKKPKITIWQFPTERRVFIDDVEIFIRSNEEADSAEDFILHNDQLLHPHKRLHDLHKDLIDDEKIPAFRPPIGKEDKKSDNENGHSRKRSVISPEVKLFRDKRSTADNEMVEIHEAFKIIEDETGVRGPKDRNRRNWDLYDYLRWLLNDLDAASVHDAFAKSSSRQKDDNKSGETENSTHNSLETTKSGESDEKLYDFPDNFKLMVTNMDNNKKQYGIISEITQVPFLPVKPEALKVFLEEFVNDKAKRS